MKNWENFTILFFQKEIRMFVETMGFIRDISLIFKLVKADTIFKSMWIITEEQPTLINQRYLKVRERKLFKLERCYHIFQVKNEKMIFRIFTIFSNLINVICHTELYRRSKTEYTHGI